MLANNVICSNVDALGEAFPRYDAGEMMPPVSSSCNQQPFVDVEQKVQLQVKIAARIRPYLFLHSEDLTQEMDTAQSKTSSEFLAGLVNAWEWHAAACLRAAQFLSARPPGALGSLSLTEWQLLGDLADDVFRSDTEKTIYSASTKPFITRVAEQFIANHPELSTEQQLLVITPSEETFYTRYRNDHVRLKLADGEDRERIELELIAQYHHGDVELFQARYNEMPLHRMSSQQLAELIVRNQDAERRKKDEKVALMDEYPELQPLDDILTYDNWDEYLYVQQQIPFIDIHLRTFIIERCAELGIADGSQDVFSYTKQEIQELIERAMEKVRDYYIVPLRTYQQTVTSCGVSSLMTILREGGVPATTEQELLWWRQSGAPYNFPGGLGKILRGLGREAVYYIDRNQHFLPGEYPVEDYDSNPHTRETVGLYTQLFYEATAQGMGTGISHLKFDDIITAQQEGWLPIIGLHMPTNRRILHWVVASGYENADTAHRTRLLIADPLNTIHSMSRGQFEAWTNTYMGRRFIFTPKV